MNERILLFPLLVLLLAGCGADDGRVSISGTVFVDDQPSEGVSIVFESESGILSAATSSAGGEFTARVAPGPNRIAASKEEQSAAATVSDDPEAQTMGTMEEAQAMMQQAPKQLIAPKFADTQQSGISFDLNEGDSIEIKVTSQ